MINKTKTKEFHLVCNNNLKSKLLNISRELDLSLSKTISFIADKMEFLSKKIHLTYPDENNRVENVNWDCHIHVYFSGDKKYIYKRLKSIHKDNNSYSIAGKLRYLLKIFIKGVEMYGLESFCGMIRRGAEKLERIVKVKKVWHKKNEVRQLNYNDYFFVQYNTEFSINFIKLLI